MKSQQLTYAQRIAVAVRFEQRCARCGEHAGGLRGGEVHHRVPRRMGGTRDPRSSDPRNLVLLCQPCHEWIERNRAEALTGGWLLHTYAGLDDAMFPLDRTILFIDAIGSVHRYDVEDEPPTLAALADLPMEVER